MKKQTEESLQATCVRWFNNNYCLKSHNPRHLIFAVPNGGSRNAIEAKNMKASGILAGVADLIVVQQGRVLFIELKNGDKGVQSRAQKEFEQRVTALGFQYYLVRDFEGFRSIFL